MGEQHAVEDRPHLHRDRCARRPTVPVQTGSPGRQSLATGHGARRRRSDGDAAVDRPRPRHRARSAPEQHDALALEAHELGSPHLAGDAALALVEQVVDRGGDRGQRCATSPCGARRLEAVGKFLGDEAGGEPPLAPARMLHQRRRNGMLWRMPSIAKASSAVACASIAASRVGACVTSLAIIGS